MLHKKHLQVFAACLCLTLLSMLCACAVTEDITCYASEPQAEGAPAEEMAAEEAPRTAPIEPGEPLAQPDTPDAQPELSNAAPSVAHTPEAGAIPADEDRDESGDMAVEICALPLDGRTVASLTHEQALEDELFGSLFPFSAPEGFTAEAISRNDDSLAGLWSDGYRELYWVVRAWEDADTARVTAASDTENYDLSLYPIPRADSVPEALREIVDDPIFDAGELTQAVVDARTYTGDEGYACLHFSVKYGELLVTVRAKGVDPAWVYAQLAALAQR